MTRSQIETLDAATSTLTLSLDIGLYPRDVLYAAAYVFLDRAYVLLDRVESRFVVHFAPSTRSRRRRSRHGGRVRERAPGAGAAASGGRREPADHRGRGRRRDRGGARPASKDSGATGLEGATLIDPADPQDGFVADPQGIARPWEPNKGTE
jgi:hypothetical protein